MRTTTRTLLTTTAALALVAPLAACSDADDDSQAPPAITGGDGTPPSDDDAPGATDDDTSGFGATDDATSSPGVTDDPTSTGGGGPGDVDHNSAVLDAVALAEQEAGGVAFEVDREDDDGWEVSVAVGEDDVEVAVSLDGSAVLGSREDGSLFSNERAALDRATIAIADAITTALDEVGGTIDDVDLDIDLHDDGDDESPAWEVSIDTADDDVEVYVDATSGEVLGVDR